MAIKTSLISHYRNSELLQFFHDTVSLCRQQNLEQLQIQDEVNDLEAKLTPLDETYKQNTGSAITQELIELDMRRDDGFAGIKNVVQGYASHYEPSVREAALLINSSIEKYGTDLNRMNYQAETSNLDNLVHDWESDGRLAAAISTLGLESWVTEIKSANELFNERFLARVQEKALAPEVKIPEMRLEAINSYRTLTNYINAHHMISRNNDYENLISGINVLIDKYNNLVTMRSGGSSEEE